jgi:hypothetical protein
MDQIEGQTIYCSYVPPNNPLPLTSGGKILDWGKNKLPHRVLVKLNILGLLEIHRDLSIIVRI